MSSSSCSDHAGEVGVGEGEHSSSAVALVLAKSRPPRRHSPSANTGVLSRRQRDEQSTGKTIFTQVSCSMRLENVYRHKNTGESESSRSHLMLICWFESLTMKLVRQLNQEVANIP